MRRTASFVLAAALAACGGGAATPTPAGGGPGASKPGSAATQGGPGATPGGGGGGGQTPSYQAGAASASVTVAGSSHDFTGGTCKQGSTVLYLFELTAGTFDAPPYIDVYVADASTPIHDGDYRGGFTLVTLQIDDQNYAVPATVTLTDGVTRGSFTGTSAGNDPKEVSGTFAC